MFQSSRRLAQSAVSISDTHTRDQPEFTRTNLGPRDYVPHSGGSCPQRFFCLGWMCCFVATCLVRQFGMICTHRRCMVADAHRWMWASAQHGGRRSPWCNWELGSVAHSSPLMCEGGCEFPQDSGWSELDHPYYHAVIGTLVSMLLRIC